MCCNRVRVVLTFFFPFETGSCLARARPTTTGPARVVRVSVRSPCDGKCAANELSLASYTTILSTMEKYINARKQITDYYVQVAIKSK